MPELSGWPIIAPLREEFGSFQGKSRNSDCWGQLSLSLLNLLGLPKFEVKKQYKIYLLVPGSMRLPIKALVWKILK